MQNLCCENEFYLLKSKKKNFRINGFTLSLTLERRLEATQKWHILLSYLYLVFKKLMTDTPLHVSQLDA